MISNQHLIALECLDLAVKALEEIQSVAEAGDYEMAAMKAFNAVEEIRRKQVLCI